MQSSIFKRILCSIILLAAFFASSCISNETASTPFSAEISYILPEERITWRAPLINLLSSMKSSPIGDASDTTSQSTTAPSIEYGYDFGLFDFDLNGVPELLVNLGGGSAGNAYFYVYDLLTGRHLGALSGGFDDSWCLYFNISTKTYEVIGQYQWRIGYSGRERYVSRALFAAQDASDGNTIVQSDLFFASCNIDLVDTQEQYSTQYHLNGESVSIDAYFSAYDKFVETCVRIPRTGLKLFSYSDLTVEGLSESERAEALADLLLSSDQAFLSPPQ